MLENKAASRYAKSILDLATEQNALEQVKNDMLLIEEVIDKNPELEAILKNPIVPADKKCGILEGLFHGKVDKITISFLKLMVNKGRSEIVFGTSKEVIAQYNQLKGIVTAEVTSATPLTESSREEIIATVKREIGAKQVLIREKTNADLIGGFVLKVGDRQFDASISNGLKKLKKEFAQGVV
ncbi:ATP synthase F1 subunit delta [Pedobacter nutrimenti]|jgi:F-type H+-transporting ATPase subunit delta|uniref:ATP synthase subunit delta n=1 Tax=Pedobacter nutrimenti TaxID=1241337 RepID=A0A318U9K6_9SPHI|nr:ATP synthase F1 subunit delta [Pedobacter nutrimenti]PYF70652.1 F-type H+-transporting ATPase subunit delta [Pedobacter nutrimenti]